MLHGEVHLPLVPSTVHTDQSDHFNPAVNYLKTVNTWEIFLNYASIIETQKGSLYYTSPIGEDSNAKNPRQKCKLMNRVAFICEKFLMVDITSESRFYK